MWKKEDMPTPSPAPQMEPPSRLDRPSVTVTSTERATIGRSITIRGDVTGDEDLLIQGRVDGSVDLKQHAITVGTDGDVRASVVGRIVVVEGKVEGNISSEEQVILRSSAWVVGDITAPRVVLEDGARFRGGVDMGEAADRQKAGRTSSTPANRPMNARSNPVVESLTEKGKVGSETPVEVAT